MLADLSRSLLAVCLYPLFVVIPGYSLAWLLDLCEFRRRTPAFRAALSLCLSFAVCPVTTYLAERFGSARLVWALYGAAWLYFTVVVARGWRTRPPIRISRKDAAVAAIVLVWVVVALVSLADLQLGGRLYYSVTAMDSSLRSALGHSLASGIPPRNPFYFPGHPVSVRYHYFWMIPGALVERAGGGLLGARQAWIGGAVWSGIALMAVVALSFRIPFYRGPGSFRRRALTGILLLGVTGLDIVPASIGWMLRAGGMRNGVLPSIDWWNEQVCGFVSTALWEAHYLAGLVICVTAFLLLWEGTQRSARVRYAVVAGIALASAVGVAVYVTLVFAAFLAVWFLVAAVRKWWSEAAAYAIAGATAAVCSAPYLLAIRGMAGGASGPALLFHVRPFSPVSVVLQSLGITHGWPLSLASLATLPLNYALELGFFFVAGILWWNRRQRPLSRAHLATATMLATSLLIATFVRSSPSTNNDLGWRGTLVAQFVLLLWAVDAITGVAGPLKVSLRRQLAVLALLGAAGTVYDVAMLRLYPWLADRGVVASVGWMAPDRQLGERTYAQREAYEWLGQATPPQTRIQFNPHVIIQDTPAYLYADRPMVAAYGDCRRLVIFGGEPALCPPIQAVLDRLYPEPGQPAALAGAAEACGSLPIDILVAKDTDAAWRDPRSWVWQEKPVFANRYVRLFGCGPAWWNRSGPGGTAVAAPAGPDRSRDR
jgi:hypothetical protein